MTFAREATPFVVPVGVLAGLAAWLGRSWLAAVLAALAFGLLLFFRIPRRPNPAEEDAVVAPANGVVTAVDRVVETALGDAPVHRIVTFLSVFDIHVQKAPFPGTVVASRAAPGRKVAAFRKDADQVNANHLVVLETESGRRLAWKQIVGLVARRIVCDLREGDRVERGQRVGLIKFGSRVDLFLPNSCEVTVDVGERLLEGSTVVARWEDGS